MGTERRGMTQKAWVVTALFVAAAAAVLYFTYFNPPASQEESAGTIGAVSKYRAPQISENDVILAGQEARQGMSRPDEFLDDAVKLQNISLGMKDLGARLRSRDGEELGKRVRNLSVELGRLSQLVDNQASVLEKKVRSMSAVTESINLALEARSSDAELAGMRSEVADLAARLAGATRLDAREVGNLAAELDAKIAGLENRKLAMINLESMGAELGSLQQELANMAQLDARRLDQMGDALESYAKFLENRSGLGSRPLAEHRSQLQAMVLESRALANAEAELASIRKLAGSAAVESKAADELGARLASAAEALSSTTLELEQKAVLGMKEQLASFTLEQRSIQSLDSAARAMSRNLESRAASGLESAAVLGKKVRSFTDTLESVSRLYGARSAAALGNQLAASAGYMESRRDLGSQVLESMRGYVAEARTVASSFALEQQAKQGLDSRLSGLNSRLESAAGDLESRRAR